MLVCGVAVLCTSCILCFHVLKIVSKHSNRFCLCMRIIVAASECLNAVSCASGVRSYNTIIPNVTCCRLNISVRITAIASVFCITFCRTSGRGYIFLVHMSAHFCATNVTNVIRNCCISALARYFSAVCANVGRCLFCVYAHFFATLVAYVI